MKRQRQYTSRSSSLLSYIVRATSASTKVQSMEIMLPSANLTSTQAASILNAQEITLSIISSQKRKNPNPAPSEIRFGLFVFGTPEGTRTPDLLIRSQSLYPTELPAHAHAQVLRYNNTVRGKKQVFFSKKSDYFLLPFGSTPALTREAFL